MTNLLSQKSLDGGDEANFSLIYVFDELSQMEEKNNGFALQKASSFDVGTDIAITRFRKAKYPKR